MLTDKQIEREKAFCEDWYTNRKMGKFPTYAEVIAWADKTMIDKAYEYAETRYDLDYCGDVRDVLNYLKSLVEE